MQHSIAVEPFATPRNQRNASTDRFNVYTPVIMPPTLRRMHRVASIPDVLSALELRRDLAMQNLTRMHGVFTEHRGKVAREVRVDRGVVPFLPFAEHGVAGCGVGIRQGAWRDEAMLVLA